MGGRWCKVVRPGCSSIHVHPRMMHKHTNIANLVAHTFPIQQNGNGLPHGEVALLPCVPEAMNPKDSHGTPPKRRPRGTSLNVSSSAFTNPRSEVRSPKTASLDNSKACLAEHGAGGRFSGLELDF